MAWNEAVVTNDGMNLISECMIEGNVIITRAAAGEQYSDPTSLIAKKDISAPNHFLNIAYTNTDNGKITVNVRIQNSDADMSYTIKQIGIFAKSDKSEEVLLALIQDKNGEVIPSQEENPEYLSEFDFVIPISNSEKISVDITPNTFATLEDVNKATNEIKQQLNSGEGVNASTFDGKNAADFAPADHTHTTADIADFPTALPANGGNADTVNGHTVNADVPENAVFTDTVYSLPAATKTALGGVKVGDNLSVAADGTLSAPIYSNPNLLDNPDFKINQRGVSGTITAAGYFVDRWKLKSGSVTVNDNKTLTLNGTIEQILENAAGTNVTASSNAGTISYNNSTKTFSLTGQNITVSWVKLELGNKATPFVPPSPSKEFIKCLYYYEKSVSTVWTAIPDNSAFNNLLMGITFVMPKRIKPSIKLFTLYHNGVDASSTYFNSISTAAVSISDMYPQYRVTNGILTTKQAPVKNDFSYKIVYEASADL